MGYYVRVLTPSRSRVSADAIRKMMKRVPGIAVQISGPKEGWGQVYVGAKPDPDEAPVLSVERDSVTRGSLGEEEVDEFDAELKKALPRSGARWVRAYLKKVKTIYAIQLHSAARHHPKAIEAMVEGLRKATRGIVQADGNGFSNENGDCVVWQFSPRASGEWTMAVLDRKGKWASFEMELSDEAARDAFLNGRVPKEAQR